MIRARTLAVALAATFLAMAVEAAPALAASKATLTAYDVLSLPGAASTLRFKVERDNFIRWDLEGVNVDFWIWDTAQNGGAGAWRYLGRSRSEDDGYADLIKASPTVAGDYIVAGKVAPGQRYESTTRYLWLGVRPASERIVVTDIDWTIAAVSWQDFLWKTSAQVPPVRGSVQALRDLDQNATVVYLTARDDYYATKTRGWLDLKGFPKGQLICSDGLTMVGDPTNYKKAAIREIKSRFPNTIAGFGNKDTDHNAYVANGLRSYMWTTETTSFPAGALVYRDWEDLRAAVRRGERPELNWATSFR